jgi:hypothetical protein
LDCDHDAVIAIQNGNFAWEIENREISSGRPVGPPSKSKKKSNPKQATEGNGTAKSKSPTPEQERLTTEEKKSTDFIKLEDCLKDINLEIKRGSLIGVCGTGK